jgi:hypothetical protein
MGLDALRGQGRQGRPRGFSVTVADSPRNSSERGDSPPGAPSFISRRNSSVTFRFRRVLKGCEDRREGIRRAFPEAPRVRPLARGIGVTAATICGDLLHTATTAGWTLVGHEAMCSR